MKIAITGKGGVGKTTLASLLAHIYAARGRSVLAIDADPSPNLGAALGFPPEQVARIVPIAEMEELIAERTESQPGSYGGWFKMNPYVSDIPDRFSVEQDGIKLLELGEVQKGGSGCICPPSVLLKNLVTHLLLRRQEVVIMDMYAGVEHLGRATASAVDAMLIVVEPGQRSTTTAARIRDLARDIGIQRLFVVGNKVRDEADRAFILENSAGLPVLGLLPATPRAVEADQRGESIYTAAPELAQAAEEIATALDELVAEALSV